MKWMFSFTFIVFLINIGIIFYLIHWIVTKITNIKENIGLAATIIVSIAMLFIIEIMVVVIFLKDFIFYKRRLI